MAGERPFDAAARFPGGLARCEQPLVVGACLGVVADPLEGDDVQCPVELAIAASVQPVASLLAARGIDRTGAGERGEGCLAPHPAGVAARDEQLGAADRSHTALREQIGRYLGQQLGQRSLGLGHLLRQSLDALAKPPEHAVSDIWTRPQLSRRVGESLAGERSQALADVIGGGDEDRAQLVEGGSARLHGAATLEQEQTQILAPTTPAGNAQALAGEQPARGQSRVDEIVLPPPPLLAARALALLHAEAGSLEVTDEPCAVTARALDGEGGHAELLRPGEQAAIAGRGRRDLLAVELGAERVEGGIGLALDPTCLPPSPRSTGR